MHKMALLPLLLPLLLTACAERPDRVPADLLVCAPAPDVPVTDSQAVVGEYLVDLWAAGDDCRQKLTLVRGMMGGEKK